jgi:hypothetical protein
MEGTKDQTLEYFKWIWRELWNYYRPYLASWRGNAWMRGLSAAKHEMDLCWLQAS